MAHLFNIAGQTPTCGDLARPTLWGWVRGRYERTFSSALERKARIEVKSGLDAEYWLVTVPTRDRVHDPNKKKKRRRRRMTRLENRGRRHTHDSLHFEIWVKQSEDSCVLV